MKSNKASKINKLSNKNSTNFLCNIKSVYILKKIFNNLNIIKKLKLINFNKSIQKRLDINIDNYKSNYTEIIIEIIPIQNSYGDFIHKFKEKDEKYIHIYLNDNKEEIKRNYLKKEDNAKNIKIIIDHQINSVKKLFKDCTSIESIKFLQFERWNITDMSHMFNRCISLKKIDFGNINTTNVTKMVCMFYGCASLQKINFSNFSTNNVTDMSYMFAGCENLIKLDLSSFNNYKTINMTGMFYKCTSLQKINFGYFDTSNVIKMDNMFQLCPSLQEINFSDFNTINVKSMRYMFAESPFLYNKISLSNFNISNSIDIKGMFSGCKPDIKMKIKAMFKNIRSEAFN